MGKLKSQNVINGVGGPNFRTQFNFAKTKQDQLLHNIGMLRKL